MPRSRGISIRTILSSVICTMGLLLVALNMEALVGALTRYRDAERLSVLVGADKALFDTERATRWERGTGLVALAAAEPAGEDDLAAIAANRVRAEAGLADAMGRLAALPQPGLAPLRSLVQATYDAYVPVRAEVDAAIRLPRSAPRPGADRPLGEDRARPGRLAAPDQLRPRSLAETLGPGRGRSPGRQARSLDRL